MKIKEIVNEIFDVSKMAQPALIQKSVAKLNDFIAKNPSAAKDISAEPMQIGSNFQAMLTAMMAQQKQEGEEKKRKDMEDAAKAKAAIKTSGVGTTVPIKPAVPVLQGNTVPLGK